jgi:hypothetical protein
VPWRGERRAGRRRRGPAAQLASPAGAQRARPPGEGSGQQGGAGALSPRALVSGHLPSLLAASLIFLNGALAAFLAPFQLELQRRALTGGDRRGRAGEIDRLLDALDLHPAVSGGDERARGGSDYLRADPQRKALAEATTGRVPLPTNVGVAFTCRWAARASSWSGPQSTSRGPPTLHPARPSRWWGRGRSSSQSPHP